MEDLHQPESTLADAIIRARVGTTVVSAALERLSALPEFLVETAAGERLPFAAERLATSIRSACQLVGQADEALAAEAAYLAVSLLLERLAVVESAAVEQVVTLSELRCAAYDALIEQGNHLAARAYLTGCSLASFGPKRRGPGLILQPLPLAATGIGDAKTLERAVIFAEKIIQLGVSSAVFANDASKSAFADAVAKLDAAAAWKWGGECNSLVSFAPLSSVPTTSGLMFGGQPNYYVPNCHLNFSTFATAEGVRAEALLAAVEVALVVADILVTDPATTSASANSLRHVQIGLDISAYQDLPVAVINSLVEGQLIAASARLARALGSFRAWPLNEKVALRHIGRLRDQANKLATSTTPELADRLRLVWDEALELAMAHGLRNAALFSAFNASHHSLAPTRPAKPDQSTEVNESALHHTFKINQVPAELWLSLKNHRPTSLSIRCGAPGSATAIILDTACATITAALTNGVDVSQAVKPLLGSSFPPRGQSDNQAIPSATSPLDYACRWLIDQFPTKV